jgi:hypothetical protein
VENSKGNVNPVFKLALYGDSLANPRHGIVKSEERYIALIENHLRNKQKYEYFEIRDRAEGGATLSKLYNQYIEDNTYFELPGNILIIHSGIVDCAPRPINEYNRTKISKLPGFLKKTAIKYIHENRAVLLKKNGGYVKTELTKFTELMKNFINEGMNNYDCCFVINICPTNKEIEKHSPGFTNNINAYNDVIYKLIINTGSDKINLVNLNQMIKDNIEEIDKYVVKEDGHHIHAITHHWIAQEIINKLK